MKYKVGENYEIKTSIVNNQLNGSVFYCYMVGELDDGTQIVWGMFFNPVTIDDQEYDVLTLRSDEMICREVN